MNTNAESSKRVHPSQGLSLRETYSETNTNFVALDDAILTELDRALKRND